MPLINPSTGGGGGSTDTSGLVPYQGASQNLDLGGFELNLSEGGSVNVNTEDGGGINFNNTDGTQKWTLITSEAPDQIKFRQSDGGVGGSLVFDLSTLEAGDKIFTFPQTGGLVLTTDTISGYVPEEGVVSNGAVEARITDLSSDFGPGLFIHAIEDDSQMAYLTFPSFFGIYGNTGPDGLGSWDSGLDFSSGGLQIFTPEGQTITHNGVPLGGGGAVEFVTAGTFTADTTITGLDGDADGVYEVVIEVSDDSNVTPVIQFNEDIFNSHYQYTWFEYGRTGNADLSHNSTSTASGNGGISANPTSTNIVLKMTIYAKSGKVRLVEAEIIGYTDTGNFRRLSGMASWTNTAANLTSIDIVNMGGITSGSYRVYKYQQAA